MPEADTAHACARFVMEDGVKSVFALQRASHSRKQLFGVLRAAFRFDESD
jgi:hypothetical protein